MLTRESQAAWSHLVTRLGGTVVIQPEVCLTPEATLPLGMNPESRWERAVHALGAVLVLASNSK